MIVLMLIVVIRILLVFATAPAPYFMYYLTAYLCSYIISAIVIIEFVSNLIDKKYLKNSSNNRG